MKKENNKSKKYLQLTSIKGITLIALVVTIIVLLILAAVAISLTIGQNGIFSRAEDAVIANENASIKEALTLLNADRTIDMQLYNGRISTIEYLYYLGYINEYLVVNVSKIGSNYRTGQGSDGKDVYVVNEKNELIYYDEDGNERNLGLIGDEIPEQSMELVYEFNYANQTCVCKGPKDYDYFYQNSKTNKERWIMDIPESVNGYTVIGIEFKRYRSDNNGWGSGIRQVNIPKTVLEITSWGDFEFSQVENIFVDDENPVYFDEDGVLYGREEDESVTLIKYPPKRQNVEIRNDTKNIDEKAILNMDIGGSITIPESVTYIDENAFYSVRCENFTILGSITALENNTFRFCNIKTLSLPNTINTIKSQAFYSTDIENLEIPDSVVDIQSGAFDYYCEINNLVIPGNVKKLKSNTFDYYVELGNVTISSGVETIENECFECSIENLIIEEGITNFNMNAIYRYANIETIELPSTIETIESHTDTYKPRVTEIIINKPEGTIDGEPWGLENVNVVWNG